MRRTSGCRRTLANAPHRGKGPEAEGIPHLLRSGRFVTYICCMKQGIRVRGEITGIQFKSNFEAPLAKNDRKDHVMPADWGKGEEAGVASGSGLYRRAGPADQIPSHPGEITRIMSCNQLQLQWGEIPSPALLPRCSPGSRTKRRRHGTDGGPERKP